MAKLIQTAKSEDFIKEELDKGKVIGEPPVKKSKKRKGLVVIKLKAEPEAAEGHAFPSDAQVKEWYNSGNVVHNIMEFLGVEGEMNESIISDYLIVELTKDEKALRNAVDSCVKAYYEFNTDQE